MPNKLDLIDQEFGKLLVLREDEERSRKGEVKWICQCKCGNITSVIGSNLRNDNTGSCGCSRHDKALPYGMAARNRVFSQHYRLRAKRQGLSFTITIEEFTELSQQNCFYCGASPARVKSLLENTGNFVYNGLDRIDNSIGYELSNVVPCCMMCNRGKKNYKQAEFLIYLKRLAKYHNNLEAEKKQFKLPCGEPSRNQVFRQYYNDARRGGRAFELTREEFTGLAQQSCCYCGVPPSQVMKISQVSEVFVYNGLDRVDNSKGYTPNNVVPCCKICNWVKSNLDYDTFLMWLDRVIKKYREKE